MGRRRVTSMALLSCINPSPLSCANHEANGSSVALAISPSNIAILPGRSGLGGGNRLDLKDGVEQVLDDLGLTLLAGLLDALDLSVGLLVGLVLGLLVTLAVLHTVGQLSRRGRKRCGRCMYLGLELLVLVLLVVLVVGYLSLGLIASLTNTLGAD